MDGPDPDSGTAWEVGYAFGVRKPIVLVRTDFRMLAGNVGDYNPMLTQAATIRVHAPAGSTTEVVDAVLDVLERIENGRDRTSAGEAANRVVMPGRGDWTKRGGWSGERKGRSGARDRSGVRNVTLL